MDFGNTLFNIANHSPANKMQVGCIIVRNDNVIASGFNKPLDGLGFVCENEFNKTFDYVVHAEANAIFNAYKNGNINLSDCVIYITHSPCANCLKLIAQAGIKEIRYYIPYKYGIPEWAKQLNIKFIKENI